VPVQRRPARAPSRSDASNGEGRPDNRLSFMDQAFFLTLRAAGRSEVVQSVWIYEHAMDFDGLRRFHRNLDYGLLGRRIERSPLPFARHRWVSYRGPSDIDIAKCARPRDELSDWVDERARLAIDPERGPSWHLGVLPLTDGSTAVSLVASHCLIDGLGIGRAIADAANGNTRDLGYPPPCSRTRLRAVVQDVRQTVQSVPEVARALVATAKMARHHRDDLAPPAASRRLAVPGGDGGERIVVPSIAFHIDLDHWDARARALGGSSHHLAAGFAAKLGERMGRRRAGDGAVTLQVPLSDRTEDDTRATALSFVTVGVNPTPVTTDLTEARTAIRQAFAALRQAPEQSSPISAMSPLVSLTPKRVLRRFALAVAASADLPVTCSSLGDIDPATGRPDGTDADATYGRGLDQYAIFERTYGQLSVLAVRISGRICITVSAYQPGGKNSKPDLRELVTHTLAEFGLTGVID
jgi:hypothetical protein